MDARLSKIGIYDKNVALRDLISYLTIGHWYLFTRLEWPLYINNPKITLSYHKYSILFLRATLISEGHSDIFIYVYS